MLISIMWRCSVMKIAIVYFEIILLHCKVKERTVRVRELRTIQSPCYNGLDPLLAAELP